MKFTLSLFSMTIVFSAFLVFSQTGLAQSLLCSEQGASLAARAYTYSNPFVYQEQTYHDFIEDNAVMFRSGGDAEVCFRRLGAVFIKLGLAQPGGQYDPDIAMETFGGMLPGELAHLPAEVDASIAGMASNLQGNLVLSGLSYLWLARALSDAANGSWTIFERCDDFLFSNNLQQYQQTLQYCQMGIAPQVLCNVSTYESVASEGERELRALASTSSLSEFDSMLNEIFNRGMEIMAPYMH